MKDFDPTYLGLNYDTGHAVRRGGAGMVDGLHVAHRYIRGLAIKDSKPAINPQTGAVTNAWVPAGEGLVNFKQVFDILKAKGWRGPINIHYEHHGLARQRAGPVQAGDAGRGIQDDREEGPGLHPRRHEGLRDVTRSDLRRILGIPR